MPPGIEARDLSRSFKGVPAVEGLTFTIGQGEVFGLLGPNGAGKTTTVRLLAGLIAPTSGEATVNGWPLSGDKRRLRRSVGILTEHAGLYERLSVRVNLEFFARLYGLEGRELAAQVDRYMRLLDLWDAQHTPAGKLSRGMQQKASLARALVHEPAVLFLDEPTSNLDPASALVVRDAIRRVQQEQRCVVLCTHNLREAEALCDRVAILKRRLLCVDSTPNLCRGQRTRQVVVRLAADEERFRDLISGMPFVQQCAREDGHLLVQMADPERDNPELIARLIGAGAQVQFVSERRPTLEQVYLELVSDGD